MWGLWWWAGVRGWPCSPCLVSGWPLKSQWWSTREGHPAGGHCSSSPTLLEGVTQTSRLFASCTCYLGAHCCRSCRGSKNVAKRLPSDVPHCHSGYLGRNQWQDPGSVHGRRKGRSTGGGRGPRETPSPRGGRTRRGSSIGRGHRCQPLLRPCIACSVHEATPRPGEGPNSVKDKQAHTHHRRLVLLRGGLEISQANAHERVGHTSDPLVLLFPCSVTCRLSHRHVHFRGEAGPLSGPHGRSDPGGSPSPVQGPPVRQCVCLLQHGSCGFFSCFSKCGPQSSSVGVAGGLLDCRSLGLT